MAKTRQRKTGSRSAIEKADLNVAETVAGWRDHPVMMALGKLSEAADQPPLYALSFATLAFGLLRSDRRMARAGLRMLAAEWLATGAKNFVKKRVDRTRPHVPANGGRYRMKKGNSQDKALSSFPSGHTAGAVAVARAFASEYPEHGATAGVVAALAGIIQIPRSMHFVSDVGAGGAIGFAAGSLVARSSA